METYCLLDSAIVRLSLQLVAESSEVVGQMRSEQTQVIAISISASSPSWVGQDMP